jgi:hypothetical protein
MSIGKFALVMWTTTKPELPVESRTVSSKVMACQGDSGTAAAHGEGSDSACQGVSPSAACHGVLKVDAFHGSSITDATGLRSRQNVWSIAGVAVAVLTPVMVSWPVPPVRAAMLVAAKRTIVAEPVAAADGFPVLLKVSVARLLAGDWFAPKAPNVRRAVAADVVAAELVAVKVRLPAPVAENDPAVFPVPKSVRDAVVAVAGAVAGVVPVSVRIAVPDPLALLPLMAMRLIAVIPELLTPTIPVGVTVITRTRVTRPVRDPGAAADPVRTIDAVADSGAA